MGGALVRRLVTYHRGARSLCRRDLGLARMLLCEERVLRQRVCLQLMMAGMLWLAEHSLVIFVAGGGAVGVGKTWCVRNPAKIHHGRVSEIKCGGKWAMLRR